MPFFFLAHPALFFREGERGKRKRKNGKKIGKKKKKKKKKEKKNNNLKKRWKAKRLEKRIGPTRINAMKKTQVLIPSISESFFFFSEKKN